MKSYDTRFPRFRRSVGAQGCAPQDKSPILLKPYGIWGFPVAFALLMAATWPARAAAQSSGSYQVDSKASHIEIHLFKGGVLSALGDDHLIALASFSGTAQLGDGKPWWVRMLAKAGSLTVLDPGASPSERQEVADTMLGPNQLDVKNYPAIKLRSSSIIRREDSPTWSLLAEVTLHGVTRQVEFPLDCQENGDRVRVRGKKDLRLRDFNIQPYSAAFGAFRVKNEFEVTYDITLERKP